MIRLRAILTVYLKELLDIRRDRKTLIFMLLLPTVITPLLMVGLARLAVGLVESIATQEVVIVATPETQDRYRVLVHEYFRGSLVGRAMKIAQSPFARFLIQDDELRRQLDSIPPDVFNDPIAFEKWTREIGGSMDEWMNSPSALGNGIGGLDLENVDPELLEQARPEEVAQQIADFFMVTVRGLGQVRFVDPSTLPAVTDWPPNASIPTRLKTDPLGPTIYTAIRSGGVNAYLVIENDPRDLLKNPDSQVALSVYHDSSLPASSEASQRVRNVASASTRQIVANRVAHAGNTPLFLEPVRIRPGTNLATKSQVILTAVGGLLPYLILVFCFLGGIYPAIDLGAGEKERNTLETLLLTPVSRMDLALGKYLVILTTSLTAALLGVVAMSVCLAFFIPANVIEQLDIQVSPAVIIGIALLAIPPAATYAGLFLAVSIFARSFREAQNYLSPMAFFFLLPGGAALLPGIEMNTRMALIPLVNVSLLSREFLRGEVNWTYYGLTCLSCAALAAVCLVLCVAMFRREQVLFRT